MFHSHFLFSWTYGEVQQTNAGLVIESRGSIFTPFWLGNTRCSVILRFGTEAKGPTEVFPARKRSMEIGRMRGLLDGTGRLYCPVYK